MEKDDKGSTMIRMGVSGSMFLLVPAYPGCPGSKAVKRSSLLLLLHVQIPLDEAADAVANSDGDRHQLVSSSCEHEADETTPKSLVYLDRLCDRRRVECVVHTLAAVADKPQSRLVSQLHDIACRHRMSRLCRIIDDIEAFSVAAVR